LLPPSGNFEQFFDKTNLMEAINRISNTSDAIRGVQFRTNTNVPAVQMYQQAAQLNVGSKVDVLEDTLADFAHSLAELCVMNYSKEDIVNLVGANASAGWRDMTLAQFQTMYNVRIVAGSMEKPNSAFKKKEALEVGQVLGQFAQAAPGAVLRVLLRLYSQAFTDVIIKPEDWAALDQEIQANLQRGVSTAPGQQGMASTQPTAQSQQPQQGAPGVAPQQSGAPNQQQQEIMQLMELAQQLPPEAQAQIVQLSEQGAAPEQILQAIQQLVMQSMGGAQAGAAGAQQGQQAVPTPTSANGAGNASYQ
jgi:hypothetical protein